METVTVQDLGNDLVALLDKVATGKDLLILRDGQPFVQISRPRKLPKSEIKFAVLKGAMWVADDFDAPLPDDVIAEFEGR
ncbi:MAG: type II toxin-antitoxin system prevent-host-death family antitoxin [Pseudomonadota bacterium]